MALYPKDSTSAPRASNARFCRVCSRAAPDEGGAPRWVSGWCTYRESAPVRLTAPYPVWVARVPRFGGHLLGNLHHFMLENMGTRQDGLQRDDGKGHDWRQTCYRFPMRRSYNALAPTSKRNVRDPNSLLKNLKSSAFVLRFSSSYKRSVRFGSECSRRRFPYSEP